MAVLSLCAFIFSLFMYMTMVLIPVGLIVWWVFAILAGVDYRKGLMKKHADMVGKAVAENMTRNQTKSVQ